MNTLRVEPLIMYTLQIARLFHTGVLVINSINNVKIITNNVQLTSGNIQYLIQDKAVNT